MSRSAVGVPEEIVGSVDTVSGRNGLSFETPLARLASLSAPTADIDEMIAEFEASRC
jgi:hypothetical protein